MESREERTKWFNKARFGMFIHWGFYSIPARGEWAMFVERIPRGFGNSIIGTVTAKDNKAYFHIFRWPGEEAVMVGVKNKVLSAMVLKTKEKAEVKQDTSGRVVIRGLAENPPDKHDTVIALELEGRPESIRIPRS